MTGQTAGAHDWKQEAEDNEGAMKVWRRRCQAADKIIMGMVDHLDPVQFDAVDDDLDEYEKKYLRDLLKELT